MRCENKNGQAGQGGAQKHVRLLFDREQLLYDVGNLAYTESDVMPEDAEHSRHVTADVTQGGNVDRVTRVLDLVHADAIEVLYPYTRSETGVCHELRDELRERQTYEIDMYVPDSFSDTTAHVLEQLIHEWMVAAALGEWLSITNAAAAQKWKDRAAEMRREVMSRKNTRGVLRRRMHPF